MLNMDFSVDENPHFLLFAGAALERHPFIRVKPERGKNIGESQNKSHKISC